MKNIVFLAVLFALLTVGAGFAQASLDSSSGSAEVQYDEAKEAEIAANAKNRLYPGGRDEEDLKVQSQLMTPVRKVAPQAEIHAEAEPEAEE